MSIKIKKILISSFKPFKELLLEVSADNIVVFDGPNGFGKTSFYDAVELLLTGTIKRYNEIVGLVADGRSSNKDGNPLFNDSSESCHLVIKAELAVFGKPLFIMRKESKENLNKSQKIAGINLPLYDLENFEEKNSRLINSKDEDAYLEEHLGKNYKKHFHYLTYIEQQENIAILKQKSDKRTAGISHLFNTAEFSEKISNLKNLSKKVSEACDTKAETNLKTIENRLNEEREKLNTESGTQEYDRLIDWKIFHWDEKEIKFNADQYEEIVGTNGLFKKIIKLVENVQDYQGYRKNKKIDDLLEKENDLLLYLRFYKAIREEGKYARRLKFFKDVDALLNLYAKDILSWIDNGVNIFSEDLKDFLEDNHVLNFEKYSIDSKNIKNIKNSSTSLSVILNKIKQSRDSFIEAFLCKEDISTGDCPLCGHDWSSVEELKRHFDIQEENINLMLKSTDQGLDKAVEDFKEKTIKPIKAYLYDLVEKNSKDRSFAEKVQAEKDKTSKFKELENIITNLRIDASSFTEVANPEHEEKGIDALLKVIKSKRESVNIENIQPYFDKTFLDIFDDNFDNIKKLKVDNIIKKNAYIKWQLSLYQSKTIKDLNLEYASEKKRFEGAKKIEKKLKILSKTYQESLVNYQKMLIENIEILFHIYHARIAQETNNSLGLFIKSEKNGISFVESYLKDLDAIFTMSSGQLATLVIAFTLALNKRFCSNKLLFIDDPVQTLDELNFVGFVELLRNEFFDRQIFLSTHEVSTSAYIRYKFDKFNLTQQQVNLKKIMSENIDNRQMIENDAVLK